ncbi:hypothetical protein [Halobaculum sp. EA56]|uniref:hypothetical protein n=1 Tax=Halobaculum sp. EA56 TaxID=3421648 RepID=UPI003EB78437
MTGHLPTVGLLTVLLAFVGAGIALAGGIGLVAVSARLGDGVAEATTRRAYGLWSVGAVLLATGVPAVFRSTLAGAPTARALGLVGVVAGLAAVCAAPAYLWRATLDAP